MAYKLLEEFRGLFEGAKYNHRNSTLGDRVASFLFEDLYDLGRSPKFLAVVSSCDRVLNRKNVAVGKQARRGDGTFGVRVPHIVAITIPDHNIALGEVATIEIGAEVKILAKAMIKQIDRVCTDILNQVAEFKKHGGRPICVGIVGINSAKAYTSYEGSKRWPTDGKKHKHPAQEADEAEKRLMFRVQPHFDEFVTLRFQASNTRPYDFAWVNKAQTEKEYAAALVRISREYETRF
ncbi:MAG: hypothetical protein A2W68_18405 [Betaproteobacteria bacterium RIFCSPLOWO2_02_64_14]|nr:MAG: hypothetical protein A2W68_18405 [Betaproteobacteria bacterium RIFCSPLOWO2_02_64_14]